MREYIAALETHIDLMLKKWKKESKIENGRVVQFEWQFEQSHIILDLFWHDGEEHIDIICHNPHHRLRTGTWLLSDPHIEKGIMDKIGNFAQIVQSELRHE
jgi:hypothetical protein